MRLAFALSIGLSLVALGARAQPANTGTTGPLTVPGTAAGTGITATVLPPSSAAPRCQGGTGSTITTIGTTATTVCAAATGNRIWYRITNTGGTNAFCTDDGTAVTLSNWNVFVPAGGYAVSEVGYVPPAAISCIAAASTSVIANAVQVGTP